jgi:hypothetical protein
MMLGGAVFSWFMPCADPLEVFPFRGGDDSITFCPVCSMRHQLPGVEDGGEGPLMWGEVFYFCPHHFQVAQLSARTICHYMLRSMFWFRDSLFLCLLVFLGGIASFD